MLAKLKPAKVLTVSGKRVTHYLPEPVEFFVPSLEDVQKHLAKEGSLDLADDKDAMEWAGETGMLPYADEFSAWIIRAMSALARGKATGAFKVNGETPDSLALEITGSLPRSLDDLLASEAGGTFFKQKAAFLAAFTPWIEAHAKRPEMFVAALNRSSLAATPKEGWPAIEKVVNAFAETIDEGEYASYLRAVRKQLTADVEPEDWGNAEDMLNI